jgi:hypothetical protein
MTSAGTWESHHAITTLIYRYAECVDTADFDGIGALFEQGALTAEGMGREFEGRDVVAGYYRGISKVQTDGTLGTRHVTTNLIVEIDEANDTATSRSYFCVVQATPELPLQPIIAGRYFDEFARTHGTWHFARRVIAASQFGDLSAHLSFDPVAALAERKPSR